MKDKGETNEQLMDQLKEIRYLIDEVTRLESDPDKPNNMPRKYEQMFEKLLEAVPEMIFTTNPKGDILYTNRTWREYIGYSYDDAESVNIFDLVHFENLEAAKQRFIKVFKGNSLRDLEFIFKTLYGSYIDVQISLLPILDSEGNVVTAFGIGRDITEHKNVMERLRDLEEVHRSVIENSPDIIFTTDIEGTMLSVNNATKTILGFDPEEFIGKNFKDFISKETQPRVIEDLKQILNGNKVVNNTLVITKDGGERHLEYINVPITKNGIVTRIQGTIHDITDHRKAVDKLRLMFESLADGVIVTDLEGVIIELSESPRSKLRGI